MAIVRNPRPRSHSTGLVIEKTYPTAAAGTRTMARNEAHTIPRTNALRGLYPRRSRSSGTTRNGTMTATMVAPMITASRQRSMVVLFSMNQAAHKRFLRVAHHIFNAVWPIHRGERRRIADRGHRSGRDGPWSRGAGGPPRPRRPSSRHQDGVHRPRDGTDPLVPRQARREEADHAGTGGRSPWPNSCDPRAAGSMSRRGLRDRGGLRGPGAEEESLPRAR